MSIDKRFALIADDGDVLFPYVKTQRATGRTGFALSSKDARDRNGQGEYTDSLAEVIRRVVFDGKAVRARTEGKSKKERDGSFGLGKKEAHRFFVVPEFEDLVRGAAFERVVSLPAQRSERSPSGLPASSPRESLSEISDLTVDDFVGALRVHESELYGRQRSLLAAHYGTAGRLLSMHQLASAVGLESEANAIIDYGKVGRMVAEYAGIDSPGSWLHFLAVVSETKGVNDKVAWMMREPLAQALEELGWVEPVTPRLEALAAQVELRSEAGFNDLSDTVKQALVNARIGQGGFRRRMLKLWDGRCAVTGCAIAEVLTASHALPWAESSNEVRLDEFNGLPLIATLDRLFDRGLIGFADDGSIVKRGTLEWPELEMLGITTVTKLRAVHPRNIQYLRQHRFSHGLDGTS